MKNWSLPQSLTNEHFFAVSLSKRVSHAHLTIRNTIDFEQYVKLIFKTDEPICGYSAVQYNLIMESHPVLPPTTLHTKQHCPSTMLNIEEAV